MSAYGQLDSLLASVGLQRHAAALEQAGFGGPDLRALRATTDDGLRASGLKAPEIKRLRRALDDPAAGDAGRRDSTPTVYSRSTPPSVPGTASLGAIPADSAGQPFPTSTLPNQQQQV